MRANEVHNMGRIFWETLFIQLSTIEGVDEHAYCTLQRIRATRKAARFSSQASQIMSQFCIIAFDRVSLGFALRNLVSATVIPKPGIFFKTIAEVPFRLGSFVDQLLNGFPCADPDDRPPQNAPCFAVYQRQDVDRVFLFPMKVNNSSISASFTSSGTGASGRDWA